MAEKRVSVRLAAVGGRQVRAELEGVGEAGAKGFGRLSREMEAANRRLADFGRRARVAVSAASAAAVTALGAAARGTIAAAIEIRQLAEVANATPEVFQRWAAAARTAGIGQEKLADILKDVNDRVGDFLTTGGGPMADFFEQVAPKVGVTADAFARLSGPGALQLYVDTLERAGLGQQEMTFHLEAMASDATRLLPLLRGGGAEMARLGAQAQDLGAVLDADAIAAMRRTEVALLGVSLVFEGLRNRIGVAMAPGIERLANAFVGLASEGGALRGAIDALIGNLGRLGTYAATFAGIMAGRWVAGLVAAAVSVRGLATALVVLRGAIIRTGIGALIVGAGELVYQFGRLVEGAGGFGNTLAMMGDVARAVWEAIKAAASSFVDSFRAIGVEVQAVWLQVMKFLAGKWAEFLAQIAPTFNRVAGAIGSDLEIDAFGAAAWVSSFDGAILRAERSAEGFRASASATLAGAFDGVRASVDALSAAVANSEAESADALGSAGVAADRVSAAFEEAETAAGGAGGAARGAGEAAADAADALTEAAAAGVEAGEAAAIGWQAATAALGDYATRARDIGGDVGQALTGAFQSAETAVGDFVKSGKLDFRDLVTSMIADLAQLGARRFLLGPIANALTGVLGGAGGLLAGVLHGGGMVGAAGPQRLMPAAAFLAAPRLHSGGWAGLAPDEVPAILQRGERVLSRREARDHRRADRGEMPVVNVTIMTRDAESFRQSRTQVAADIARAVSLGRRGL